MNKSSKTRSKKTTPVNGRITVYQWDAQSGLRVTDGETDEVREFLMQHWFGHYDIQGAHFCIWNPLLAFEDENLETHGLGKALRAIFKENNQSSFAWLDDLGRHCVIATQYQSELDSAVQSTLQRINSGAEVCIDLRSSPKFDRVIEDVAVSDEVPSKEGRPSSPAEASSLEDLEGVEVASTFARAIETPEALTSDEWKTVTAVSVKLCERATERELKNRFNRACQIIDDLEPGEEVTAERLTRFFADKHAAARVDLKRTEGEILDDKSKEQIVEVVRLFQDLGGTVRLDGEPCVVDLRKPSNMKQRYFRVRSTARGRRQLWADVKIPELKFEIP